ncbi:hypothetical protein RCS94_06475 [Orbaceae bacterium ac157xtp]
MNKELLQQLSHQVKNASVQELAKAGVVFEGNQRPLMRDDVVQLANDAALIGNASAGIPAYAGLYMTPEAIQALYAPKRAEAIFGGYQYGTRVHHYLNFRFEELTGNVAAYGDFNNNGTAGANYNWEYRQQFEVQTNIIFGDKEAEEYALAQIDYIGGKKKSALELLERFRNASYFYGIDGLQNYGYFNDPNLNATITPLPKAAGGTSWANATNSEIYADVLHLYGVMNKRANGLIEKTDSFTLMVSADSNTALGKTDQTVGFTTAEDLIKRNFPNMTIVQVPEMETLAGNHVGLIVDNVMGGGVAAAGFSEKLRSGRLIPGTTSYSQKQSASTWGLICKQPVGIASMLGV